MKHLKLSLAAAVLILALGVTCLAGDISCGVTSTPPPSQQSEATTAGDISCGVTSTDEAPCSETTITEIALNLMQDVLALF